MLPPGRGPLAGRVAVVAVEQEALGLGLAAAGATVVLVGGDGEQAGRLLAAIEAQGAGRGAWFASAAHADVDALVRFVAEQFRPAAAAGEGGGQQAEGDHQ